MTFDRLFKLALLTVLLGFLWIGWTVRQNGRYVYHPQTEYDSAHMIDSRTGAVFELDLKSNGFTEFHPQTGEGIIHGLWVRAEGGRVTGTQILVTFVVLVSVALAILAVSRTRARKKRLLSTAKVPEPQTRTAPTVTQQTPPAPATERTPQCELIRQKLRIPLMYDEEKIDRLVAMERARTPGATEEDLHAAAYERWVQDNR